MPSHPSPHLYFRRTNALLEGRFFGVMDGAPDDQMRVPPDPNAQHVVAVILAPARSHIDSFCGTLLEIGKIERSKFQLGKWNLGKKDEQRAGFQRVFTRSFAKALHRFPMISVHMFSIVEPCMDRLWAYTVQEGKFGSFIKEFENDVGKQMVELGPIEDGDERPIVVIPRQQAAGLLWTVTALYELYSLAGLNWRRRIWNLLTDKMPGGKGMKGIRVLREFLHRITEGRLELEVTRGPDTPADFLADCLAGWTREYVEDAKSASGQAMTAIMNDRELTKRVWVRRKEFRPEALSAKAGQSST